MRILIVNVTVSVFVLVAAAVIAFGAYPQDSVTVYTGCLTAGGTITSLAASPTTPTKPCIATEQLIHLSGGTITKVTAGTGLTGGGSDGYVTVGLDPAYSLPQSCVPGNFPGWSGSLWQCYGAGTGLTADTAGKKLGIASTYQLPQTCTNGQITKSGGPNTAWTCGNQQTYSGSDFALSSQSCNSGQFVTGINSTGHTNCADDHTYSGANFALSSQDCAAAQFTTGIDGSGKLKCAAPASNPPDVFFTRPAFAGTIPTNNPSGTIGSLTVPAGSYLIFAKAYTTSSDFDPQTVTCSLSTGDSEQVRPAGEGSGNPAEETAIALLDAATFNSTTTITWTCGGFKVNIWQPVMAAVRVGLQ
jgi:hypothetical protein